MVAFTWNSSCSNSVLKTEMNGFRPTLIMKARSLLGQNSYLG